MRWMLCTLHYQFIKCGVFSAIQINAIACCRLLHVYAYMQQHKRECVVTCCAFRAARCACSFCVLCVAYQSISSVQWVAMETAMVPQNVFVNMKLYLCWRHVGFVLFCLFVVDVCCFACVVCTVCGWAIRGFIHIFAARRRSVKRREKSWFIMFI